MFFNKTGPKNISENLRVMFVLGWKNLGFYNYEPGFCLNIGKTPMNVGNGLKKKNSLNLAKELEFQVQPYFFSRLVRPAVPQLMSLKCQQVFLLKM